MNLASPFNHDSIVSKPDKAFLLTQECSDFVSIFEQQCSLCIWTPKRSETIDKYAKRLAIAGFHLTQVVSLENALSKLDTLPEGLGQSETKKWIVELIEIYATLFGLDQVGMRIASSNSPMCPKFHVDHVPTRLIHALFGEGCDWFSDHHYFSSSKGGASSLKNWLKVADKDDKSFVQRTPRGSVVIMKGTRWSEASHPVIHRSPKHRQARLVLTLDCV